MKEMICEDRRILQGRQIFFKQHSANRQNVVM